MSNPKKRRRSQSWLKHNPLPRISTTFSSDMSTNPMSGRMVRTETGYPGCVTRKLENIHESPEKRKYQYRLRASPRSTPGDQRDRSWRFPNRRTLLKAKILITNIQNFRRACSEYGIFRLDIFAELFRLRAHRVFLVLRTCTVCFAFIFRYVSFLRRFVYICLILKHFLVTQPG